MNPKLSAAIATTLWGFTYIVSTTMLPHNPLLIAAVRALGGAIVLLLLTRQFPVAAWWGKLIVLGTLNAGLFFALLFIAALRLPGGVAAIFQAFSPLCVILLGWAILGARPTLLKTAAVLIGVAGVSLVVLKGDTSIDLIGVTAALGSALSFALGGVLINKWGRPPMSMLSFTGWQLLIAGVELSLVALLANDIPERITAINIVGFLLLALLLTDLAFVLWFKAIASAGAVVVAPFILLTPITAFVLDALIKGFIPTIFQIMGAIIVFAGLFLSQWTPRARAIAVAADSGRAPHEK